MRAIRKGSKGPIIKAWQTFLVGEGAGIVPDGDFGNRTVRATKAWQAKRGLVADGIVGNASFGAAMVRGFGLVETPTAGKAGPAWPPKRAGLKPPSKRTRAQRYGKFSFKAAPTPSNPERIIITDREWRRNIIKVSIPQLAAIGRRPHMWAHTKVADSLQAIWHDWEAAGLLSLVVSYNGSYNARYIRGSRRSLSNHSWGTAFDINLRANRLGAVPALVGQPGSVRMLVPIAAKHGWFWGGWYGYGPGRGRYDGMHFEKA